MAGELLEYTNANYLHPVGLMMLLIFGLLLQFLPRKYAPVPILLMATFVSPAQRVAIFELDFDFIRLMVIFGAVRVFLHNEYRRFQWNRLDTVVLLWGVASVIMYTVQWRGSMAALVHQLGGMVDSAGMYFIFRMLVRDVSDLRNLARAIAIIAVPVGAAFTLEWMTRYNVFSIFGRVPEITEMRQGKLRCQGPFPHPIIAGCFWAVLAPLAASLWWSKGKDRLLAVAGSLCAAWIVFTCSASTPAGALMLGALAACLYPLRKHMQAVRWLIVAGGIALHFILEGPIWSIFAKVDIVGGSTGWHRYYIIDQGINRIGEWWLDGTRSTAHWGWGTFDITNHYLFIGVRGGLLCLVLFIVMLGYAFQCVGRFRAAVEGDRAAVAMAWGLGVALFVHIANFFGTTYFGQVNVALFATLGVIGSMRPTSAPQSRAVPQPQRQGVGPSPEARPEQGDTPRPQDTVVAPGPLRPIHSAPATP